MALFKVGFEGAVYEWDSESLMLSEAREIKKWLQLNPPAWLKALAVDDPDAGAALLCILRRRHGEPELRFTEVDGDLKTLTFEALDDEPQDDPSPGDAADPTQVVG